MLTSALPPAGMVTVDGWPVASFHSEALAPPKERLEMTSADVPVLAKWKALGATAPRPRTAENTSRGLGEPSTASSGEESTRWGVPAAVCCQVLVAVPTLLALSVTV